MTQEEKLKEAKRLYETANADQKYVLESLFPELKESVLIWLTKYIEEEAYSLSMDIRDNEDRIKLEKFKKSLAWLEKQGDKESQVKLPTFTFDDILALQCCMETVKKVQEDKDLYKKLNDLHSRVYDAYHLEKPQGKSALEAIKEEKVDNANKIEPKDYSSIDPCFFKATDKVEPRFKQGEWIVWQDKCYKLNYNGCGYELVDQNGLSTSLEYGTVDENAHLWDIIQDAKDGDVLCYKDEISLYKHDIKNCTKQETTFGGFVYHCCYDGKRFITDSLYSLTEQDKMDIHPASKEQRETLEKEMAEAGFTFDYENKKLKKIENVICREKNEHWRQKAIDFIKHPELIKATPTLAASTIEWLKSLKDRVHPQPKQEWSEEDEWKFSDILALLRGGESCHYNTPALFDWLKSLKDRYNWKPSDEQMEALEHFVRSIGESGYASPYDKNTKLLYSLLEQLKKLKE